MNYDTTLSLAKRAVRLYSCDLVPNRANQRAWLRAVQLLGDKWLLAKPQEKVSAS
jgi:hypothetical protein